MISVIVCSANHDYLQKLSFNIRDTIGIAYEIVAIRNENNRYNLTQAYNKGAAGSTYPYLCFIHEDIKILTNDWGKIIINHLKDSKIGLIGVAGTQYKSIVPSSWSVLPQFRSINIIQHHKFSEKERFFHNEKKSGSSYVEAIAVDGVFMATRKSVWNKYRFDETVLKGFHGYDIDFSLQVSQQYRVRVIYDILIEHFSEGNQNKEWLENAIIVSQKWENYLPKGIINLSKDNEQRLHIQVLNSFTYKLINLNYPFLRNIRLIFKYGFLSYPSYYTLKGTLNAILTLVKSFTKNLIEVKSR